MFSKIFSHRNLAIIGALSVLVLAVGLIVVLTYFVLKSVDSTEEPARTVLNTPTLAPTAVFTPVPTVISTPTAIAIPISGWKFQGFTDEFTRMNGYVYHWGNFINDNGAKIKAMCSSPNSPAPEIGAYYNWDKVNDILVPVVDNQFGDIQRFWYPTVLP